jgi:hypothetical protein
MPNRGPAALKRHYRDYQGTPEQIKKRAQRNAARAEMVKQGVAHKGDGKDVHHKTPIKSGGGNRKSNLAITAKSSNRGYPRDGKNRPI